MIAVNNLLHGDTLLAGTDSNRHAVLIASADEHYVAVVEAQVAHINIGRHIHSGKVTDVYTSIGVGKSRRHSSTGKFLFHSLSLKYLYVCGKPVKLLIFTLS